MAKKQDRSFRQVQETLSRNAKKLFIIVPVVSLLLLAALVYVFKGTFIAATVNNQPIYRLQLDKELEKQGGKSTLENLILKTIILQEAKKKQIQVTTQELEARLAEVDQQFKSQGQSLDSYLAQSGQTKADVEDQLKIQIMIEKLVGDQAKVSDQDINDYFEKNKSLYPKGTTLDSKKDEISQALKQQKLSEAFQGWIDLAKKGAKINYYLNF
ncbi:MAG: SurA N-terminal domain-containing protein [bacterium]|nr:SurA N-terminal domain-containing protein [bacterium]